jgi:NitT/TauT family transport system substrate-binding protein
VPESYLLGDRALYIDAFMKVRQPSRRTATSRRAAPIPRCARCRQFEPSLADKQIELSKTFTNSFVQKANAKYK